MTLRMRWILGYIVLVVAMLGPAGYVILDQRRVAGLIEQLGSQDDVAAIDAKNALVASTSGFTTKQLLDALGAAAEGDKHKRLISVFVEKGAPAVEPLIKRLQTPVPQPRQNAMRPGPVGPPLFVRRLVSATQVQDWTETDRFEQSRVAAAEALGRIGDRRAVPALAAALKDEDGWIVEASAKALGEIGDESALPALTALAADDKRGFGSDAVDMMGGFKEAAAPYLVDFLKSKDDNVVSSAVTALRSYGASQSDKIIRLLADDNPYVRSAALSVLGAFDKPEVTAALTAALKDPVPGLRAQALNQLNARAAAKADAAGSAGAPPTAAAGSAAAGSAPGSTPNASGGMASTGTVSTGTVSTGTASAGTATAGKTPSPEAQTLLKLLDDKSISVRLQAIIGLAKMRETAGVPKLLAELDSSNYIVRETAVRALGAIGDKRAADPLVAVMNGNGDDWLRNVASMSLAALGDPRARKVPFQDILQAPAKTAVTAESWNDAAVSSVLNQAALDRLQEDIPVFAMEQLVWPAPEEIERRGGEPTADAKASTMKWLRKFMKPEYLPDGLDRHLVSMRDREVIFSYVEAASIAHDVGADTNKPMMDSISQRALCTADIVRFKTGNRVVQIMETPYDVIIAVSDEKPQTSGKTLEALAAEVAKDVLRDTIYRDADQINSDGPVTEIELGGYVSFDRRADGRARMGDTYKAAVGAGRIKVYGDGTFVKFDIEKTDLRGIGYFELLMTGGAPLEELPTSVQ